LNNCVKAKGKITECKDEEKKFLDCKKELPVQHSLKCTATEVIMMDFPSAEKNNCGCGTDNLLNRNNDKNDGNETRRRNNKNNYKKKGILFCTFIIFFILLFILFNYIYSSYHESGPPLDETEVSS
jgi:hypothetical protein